MRKKTTESSKANNITCWYMFTSGLKGLLPFMPVMGHFQYAKATIEYYLRWEHRIQDEHLKEWHREIFIKKK